MTDHYDIAVIGNGIAGLSAAQHALSAGCSVAHVIGMEPIGGLVCNVGELQGYPAGAEPISGLDLALATLSSNVAAGDSALTTGDADTALRAFSIATAIERDDASLDEKLERAENLSLVMTSIKAGETAERDGERNSLSLVELKGDHP